MKFNTVTSGQTELWTQLVTSLLAWKGVWPLGKNAVAVIKTEFKKDPQCWFPYSFSELRKWSFHSNTCAAHPENRCKHPHGFSVLFLLSTTEPLKQSNEFTADSLWLRGAESSVGWHYRKRLHIDTKKRCKQKENTMEHFSQYKLLSTWISLMTPDEQ